MPFMMRSYYNLTITYVYLFDKEMYIPRDNECTKLLRYTLVLVTACITLDKQLKFITQAEKD